MISRKEKLQIFVDKMTTVGRNMSGHKEDLLKKFNLNKAQIEILYRLDREGSMKSSEIASQFNVTSGAVTQLIDGLVKNDFIQRTNDKEDRRVIHLELTEKGREMFQEFKKYHLEKVGNFLEVLDDEEFDTLLTLFTKIAERNSQKK